MNELKIRNIDHLVIVAGIVDQIGLVEIVNGEIGENAQEKISAGIVVKAMILNGLGFLSAPLYLFSPHSARSKELLNNFKILKSRIPQVNSRNGIIHLYYMD
jgi:hypothetical protein